MASHTPRPVIFPLSNPTALAEATPADVLRWTEGRALVGTGSPFAPVEVNGKLVRISQINNSFIFPGLALGILVSKALRVTDGMIMAAARTLAKLSPASEDSEAPLLPPIADSRKISLIVAEAVGKQAIAEGIAAIEEPSTLKEQLLAYVWEPVYLPYEKIPSNTD
jgi:malate dehydrogenase (oxaloacetate-decarboxylating)